MKWNALSWGLVLVASGFDGSSALATARPLFLQSEPHGSPADLSVAAIHAARVEIDRREIDAEILEIELLDGIRYEAVATSIQRRGADGAVWRGTIDGTHRVTLTLSKGIVAGLIHSPAGVFEIRPLGSGYHALIELDQSFYPPCAVPAESPPAAKLRERRSSGRPPLGGISEIDVMALYTPQARDGAGGKAEIEATIQSALDVTNTGFIDSDVDARLRLVHTELAEYNDSGDMGTDLNWLRYDPGVATVRDLHAADLVGLIVEDGGGYCGIAYVMRNPGSYFESWAFQVTDRGCAVGNLTYAHENGHNMGFEHDPANGSDPAGASYPWSFGHFVNGSYRTIMSYSSECTLGCTRVAHWSNPDVTRDGDPTGIDEERDNARTGHLTAPIVAGFRLGTGTGKDIVVQSVTVLDPTLLAGDAVTVDYDVANQGSVTITEPYTEDLYLSTDALLDGGDTYLGSDHQHVVDLPPGGTHAGDITGTIPSGTAPGTYYLLVEGDAGDGVPEDDEGNNASAIEITVCSGSPDLLLENDTVTTKVTYEACGTITVGSNFWILAPGDVTFQAGHSVVFADGFLIGDGAAMEVVLGAFSARPEDADEEEDEE